MYYLFAWASRIVPRLPRWLVRLLPDLIGPLAWLLAVPARKQATINALHVLGSEVQRTASGRRRLQRVVHGMFRYSVSNYLDVFLLPTLSHQEVLHRIYAAYPEYLEEALALGRGVILVTAHFGPFDYLVRWLSAHDYQVVIPVENLKDGRLLRLMLGLRRSSGIKIVPLGGSTPMRAVIQALRSNQIVIIPADRAIEGESVVRDFFGAPACLPMGPVNLSVRTGAPLVVATGWHSSRRRISGGFIRLTLALSEEERSDLELIEGRLLRELERVISMHPEQWVVFSKVWQD